MAQYTKLEIFIPEANLPDLRKALQSVDAGHIGNYDMTIRELSIAMTLPTFSRYSEKKSLR